jgi:hypothetical protein
LAERNEQLAQRDATIVALQQQVAELSKQVADLLAQVARFSKNSSNASKPLSSDIVKPPLPPVLPGEKRSVGGAIPKIYGCTQCINFGIDMYEH